MEKSVEYVGNFMFFAVGGGNRSAMRKKQGSAAEAGSETFSDRSGHAPGELPASAAERLPRYFRCLRALLLDGAVRTSSAHLAEMLGLTAAQVRSDLRHFGNAGQQGYGYYVKPLYTEISRALGVGDGLTAVLICADELGIRMADGSLFAGRGITLKARFSAGGSGTDDRATGQEATGGVPRYPLSALETILREQTADIAVIGPKCSELRGLAERLAACGVRGIWNLSEEELPSFDGVQVRNLVIGDSLMLLCYDMRRGEEPSV